MTEWPLPGKQFAYFSPAFEAPAIHSHPFVTPNARHAWMQVFPPPRGGGSIGEADRGGGVSRHIPLPCHAAGRPWPLILRQAQDEVGKRARGLASQYLMTGAAQPRPPASYDRRPQ